MGRGLKRYFAGRCKTLACLVPAAPVHAAQHGAFKLTVTAARRDLGSHSVRQYDKPGFEAVRKLLDGGNVEVIEETTKGFEEAAERCRALAALLDAARVRVLSVEASNLARQAPELTSLCLSAAAAALAPNDADRG